MNGRRTIVVDDRATVTTTVERHRVKLEFSRKDVGLVVTALSILSADETLVVKTREQARELLWRIVDDASGPRRTVDRRTPREVDA